MRSDQTAQVRIKHDTTVTELIQWLGKRPGQAKVSVFKTPGDRPFDSGEEGITVTWEEEDQPQRNRMVGPHSRACGIANHPHGHMCKPDCQTCHGKEDY